MKTKEKVKYWLEKFTHLRDNDYRLCSNIWHEEFKTYDINGDSSAQDFLKIYSLGKLTSAPSIKRARAKLQEENPELRGEKYYIRKGVAQDQWRKDLGYEVNK